MSRDHSPQKNKRRGCLGFFLTALILIGIVVILSFTTHLFDKPKNMVYSIFYPHKFSEEVQQSSREFGVDENLIYAVIRTESGFREKVVSHAGAVGLMQLMPDTFTWLQGRLDGGVIYGPEMLENAAVNIRYGTYFLSCLLELYDDVGTACAAYNAGTTTVDGWLSDSRYSQDGRTLTEIPYRETARYVEKVRHALEIYQKIYDQPRSDAN